jgi:hypothetical protein
MSHFTITMTTFGDQLSVWLSKECYLPNADVDLIVVAITETYCLTSFTDLRNCIEMQPTFLKEVGEFQKHKHDIQSVLNEMFLVDLKDMDCISLNNLVRRVVGSSVILEDGVNGRTLQMFAHDSDILEDLCKKETCSSQTRPYILKGFQMQVADWDSQKIARSLTVDFVDETTLNTVRNVHKCLVYSSNPSVLSPVLLSRSPDAAAAHLDAHLTPFLPPTKRRPRVGRISPLHANQLLNLQIALSDDIAEVGSTLI